MRDIGVRLCARNRHSGGPAYTRDRRGDGFESAMSAARPRASEGIVKRRDDNDATADTISAGGTIEIATVDVELVVDEDMEATRALPPARYREGRVLGRGGMGEVIAAVDTQIGREVAIKRMRH